MHAQVGIVLLDPLHAVQFVEEVVQVEQGEVHAVHALVDDE